MHITGHTLLGRVAGFYPGVNKPVYVASCDRRGPDGRQLFPSTRLGRYVGWHPDYQMPVWFAPSSPRLPNGNLDASSRTYLGRVIGQVSFPEGTPFKQVYTVAVCRTTCGVLVWARMANTSYGGIADYYRQNLPSATPVHYVGPGQNYPPNFSLSDYRIVFLMQPFDWDVAVNPTTLRQWLTLTPNNQGQKVLVAVGGPNPDYFVPNTVLNQFLNPQVNINTSDDTSANIDVNNPDCFTVNTADAYTYGTYQESASGGAATVSAGPGVVARVMVSPFCPWAVNAFPWLVLGSPVLLSDPVYLERFHACFNFIDCAVTYSHYYGFRNGTFPPPAGVNLTIRADTPPADLPAVVDDNARLEYAGYGLPDFGFISGLLQGHRWNKDSSSSSLTDPVNLPGWITVTSKTYRFLIAANLQGSPGQAGNAGCPLFYARWQFAQVAPQGVNSASGFSTLGGGTIGSITGLGTGGVGIFGTVDGFDADITVDGADDSGFTTGVTTILTAHVAAGNSFSFTEAPPQHNYYRVTAKDSTAGNHASVHLTLSTIDQFFFNPRIGVKYEISNSPAILGGSNNPTSQVSYEPIFVDWRNSYVILTNFSSVFGGGAIGTADVTISP